MLIDRTILNLIRQVLSGEPKIIVVYGPRQAGKTVLLGEITGSEKRKTLIFRGDDLLTQSLFSVPRLDTLENTVGDAEIIVIDEAQKIENIGQSLKLLYDNRPRFILATGSSSFHLANKLAESMTGRATFFTLYPLALSELPREETMFGLDKILPELLVFGLYPKIHTINSQVQKEQYLLDIINTYLYQDLLSFEGIRKPKKIIDLLQLLAFQIGSEVSIQELSQSLSLAKIVVEKYLDVLEKMFIVINLRGFSRNLRKEVTKTSKYYFLDLGLRNALIRNFNPLHLRNDVGSLFENFCILERMKFLSNQRKPANYYFWRTYDQKEIDLIEERDGKIKAFEFKFGTEKIPGATGQEFLKTYRDSDLTLINPNNIEKFLVL
ncbi:ATP-binding protein [Candidatus Gottesmanbacteria bacterium]|nr:ATP-binding protein [Candidatus Gottesmanbacteria bacterium]